MRWVAWVAAVPLLAVLAIVAGLRMKAPPAGVWKEFALGPATGASLRINRAEIRGDGATLITLLGWVHRLPAARVIGPGAMRRRYSLVAAVAEEDAESLRPLLKRELESRFGLESHMETRPFDVWVLTAGARPALPIAKDTASSTWIRDYDAKLEAASTANLAAALQSILGKPVVDETGLGGSYDLEFAWGEDREKSTVAVMRDRFGLVLAPGKRDLEALIVDRLRPDLSMSLFSGVGRMTRAAPPGLRRSISRALTIR
jgi:uncharacterized protein (TIGR03435 family)